MFSVFTVNGCCTEAFTMKIRLSVEVNRAFRSKIVAVSDAAAAVYPCLRTVGQNDVFLRSALRRFGHVGQDGHVEMFAEALIQQV